MSYHVLRVGPRRRLAEFVGAAWFDGNMNASQVAVENLQQGDLVTEVDTPGGPWYRVVTYDKCRRVLIVDEGIEVPVVESTSCVLRSDAER